MRIRAILDSRRILLDLPGGSKREILTALDGTTVYVENTDAEGRLVLADG